ncbi:MAG: type IV secretion system protein VirB10 [Burkholderiaceae bacterium]
MNARTEQPDDDRPGLPGAGVIQPLPGEAGIPDVEERVRQPMSKKGLLAVGLLVLSIVAVAAFGIVRLTSGKKAEDAETKLASNRPSAATTEPRKLEVPVARAAAAPVVPASAPAPRIPALVPTAEELAEPIGVRRSGQSSPTGGTPKVMPPEDAPVLLVTSRPAAPAAPAAAATASRLDASRAQEPEPQTGGTDPLDQTRQNLDAYQRQLQALLNDLTRTATAAVGGTPSGAPVGAPPMGVPPTAGLPPLVTGVPSGALFSGTLQGSATPRVAATTLGNRSLTLPKGTAFTCALKTKVISAASGLVGCQVQRNVYSDDGRVLLIERGSHLDGEYRIASVRAGTVRIPVLWTRIRTPNGITVEIESPGTGQLGESGIDGYVDNRWGERIGAAMLLSLIDDSVKLVIQNQANESNATNANTVVLPSTTANTSKLAEKVLESTINIPPLIYQNQGGIVGIYVARDVDFSSVYELRPTAFEGPKASKP